MTNGRKTLCLCLIVFVVAGSRTSCAAEGTAGRPSRWLPVDREGWTILRPTEDSRLIYVSSSEGDDGPARFYAPRDPAVGPDPFQPAGKVRPYKTIAAALNAARDGHPDWVLLKRGDVWYEAIGSPPNGRSAREPLVIAAYGKGVRRPQLRLRDKQSGVRFDIHKSFHDVAITNNGFHGASVYFLQNPDRLENVAFTRNTLLMPWQEESLIRATGNLMCCTFSSNIYWSRYPAERDLDHSARIILPAHRELKKRSFLFRT